MPGRSSSPKRSAIDETRERAFPELRMQAGLEHHRPGHPCTAEDALAPERWRGHLEEGLDAWFLPSCLA